MKDHIKKRQIRVAILAFFGSCKPGDNIQSEQIVEYCKRHLKIKTIYPDTVLRYARQLRAQEMINYTVLHKETRKMKIIAPGQSHSL